LNELRQQREAFGHAYLSAPAVRTSHQIKSCIQRFEIATMQDRYRTRAYGEGIRFSG